MLPILTVLSSNQVKTMQSSCMNAWLVSSLPTLPTCTFGFNTAKKSLYKAVKRLVGGDLYLYKSVVAGSSQIYKRERERKREREQEREREREERERERLAVIPHNTQLF